jgi:Raf kinase inhibitor-like YbhB/YbcL family protein
MRMQACVLLSAAGVLVGARSAHAFDVTSETFKNKGTLVDAQVFNGFGCKGRNISPQLSWTKPPTGTKSFAVTVYDPDAPTGAGWWHWVVWNIPASTTSLPAGAGDAKGSGLPAGAVQGKTDFGAPGYGGPCPPPGKPHRYLFTVTALKVDKLDVSADATAAPIGAEIDANALGKATLVGNYGRSK